MGEIWGKYCWASSLRPKVLIVFSIVFIVLGSLYNPKTHQNEMTGPAVASLKLLAQATGEYTRDELNKVAKLGWTDAATKQIAEAKAAELGDGSSTGAETASSGNSQGGSDSQGGGSSTGAGICDKALTRRQNRVASKDYQKLFGSFKRNHYFCTINVKLKYIMV